MMNIPSDDLKSAIAKLDIEVGYTKRTTPLSSNLVLQFIMMYPTSHA
jgi:hypothetical protein